MAKEKLLMEWYEITSVDASHLEGYSKTSDAYARFCDPNGTSEGPFTGSACEAMTCYLVKQRLVTKTTLLVKQ